MDGTLERIKVGDELTIIRHTRVGEIVKAVKLTPTRIKASDGNYYDKLTGVAYGMGVPGYAVPTTAAHRQALTNIAEREKREEALRIEADRQHGDRVAAALIQAVRIVWATDDMDVAAGTIRRVCSDYATGQLGEPGYRIGVPMPAPKTTKPKNP